MNVWSSLRIRYVIGLSVIALLVTVSFITMQRIVSAQGGFSTLINLAGHQSGLSNRIAFFAGVMVATDDEDEFLTARSQVGRTVHKMRAAHQVLREGDPDKGVPKVANETLTAIFEDHMVGLDIALERFLERAEAIYETDIEELHAGSADYIYLTNYGPHVLEPMLDAVVDEYEKISSEAIQRIERFEFFVWIAAIITLVLEAFLIFRPLESRVRSTIQSLQKARRETENILENVDEGLFLLDRNYIIGSQHSKSLHALFKDDNLAGQNFIDLLRPLVTGKTLETVEEFTEILFSPRVNESLVSDLNPLNQVEIHLTAETASFDIRYFSFQFSRVYEQKEFNALLVTVKDVTELVQLSEQLKAANEKVSKEIDMLLAIIHVENSMLTAFLRTAEEELNNVNNILRAKEKGADSLTNKLETIARIVHKLKGDSTTLGLDFVMEKFHRLEGAIKALREQTNMTGQDFLPLVVHLNHLMSDFTIIRNLEEKMNATGGPSVKTESLGPRNGTFVAFPHDSSLDGHWQRYMAALVERVAADCGKQAVLDMSDFNAAVLSEEQKAPLADIIVQSLRNAVAHGIETPVFRERAGKTREGTVKVALVKNGAGLQLTIRDDGHGIDLEKIKTTALAKGLATEDQLNDWPPAKVLTLLFRQGFTTVPESGLHAGQGVGLDLIKSRIDSLNGRVKVRFQVGRYTEFQYDFAEMRAVAN